MSEGTNTWIIQRCTTPSCEGAIRVLAGNQSPHPVCKWCRANDEHGCPYAAYSSHLPHTPDEPHEIVAATRARRPL